MDENQTFQGKCDVLDTTIAPPVRTLFGLCNDSDNIYIFGGHGKHTEILNDLWMFNGM